jgi:hypothetical protein
MKANDDPKTEEQM